MEVKLIPTEELLEAYYELQEPDLAIELFRRFQYGTSYSELAEEVNPELADFWYQQAIQMGVKEEDMAFDGPDSSAAGGTEDTEEPIPEVKPVKPVLMTWEEAFQTERYPEEEFTDVIDDAENGDAYAMINAGLFYVHHAGSKDEIQEGIRYLEEANRILSMDRQTEDVLITLYYLKQKLGNIYEREAGVSVKPDPRSGEPGDYIVITDDPAAAKRAKELYIERAELGFVSNNDPGRFDDLIRCYELGIGGERNYSEADKYRKKAAESGGVDWPLTIAVFSKMDSRNVEAIRYYQKARKAVENSEKSSPSERTALRIVSRILGQADPCGEPVQPYDKPDDDFLIKASSAGKNELYSVLNAFFGDNEKEVKALEDAHSYRMLKALTFVRNKAEEISRELEAETDTPNVDPEAGAGGQAGTLSGTAEYGADIQGMALTFEEEGEAVAKAFPGREEAFLTEQYKNEKIYLTVEKAEQKDLYAMINAGLFYLQQGGNQKEKKKGLNYLEDAHEILREKKKLTKKEEITFYYLKKELALIYSSAQYSGSQTETAGKIFMLHMEAAKIGDIAKVHPSCFDDIILSYELGFGVEKSYENADLFRKQQAESKEIDYVLTYSLLEHISGSQVEAMRYYQKAIDLEKTKAEESLAEHTAIRIMSLLLQIPDPYCDEHISPDEVPSAEFLKMAEPPVPKDLFVVLKAFYTESMSDIEALRNKKKYRMLHALFYIRSRIWEIQNPEAAERVQKYNNTESGKAERNTAPLGRPMSIPPLWVTAEEGIDDLPWPGKEK